MPMTETTYVTDEPTRAPAGFWIVAVLGALWNAFGGVDYTMSKLENRAWLGQMGDPQVFIDWLHSFPLWVNVCWGLGVWGSVLGSLLMLARSRHAAIAFAVSLVGALGSIGYQLTHSPPPMLDTPFNKAMSFVILAIVAALWWYCRRAAARGWLR